MLERGQSLLDTSTTSGGYAQPFPERGNLILPTNSNKSLVEADLASARFRSRGEILRPERLLAPFDGRNPLASIRTVHASTLFSGGAVIDGQINPNLARDLDHAHHQGVTALYVIGMWDSTAFSSLWTRHWAPTWRGYGELNPQWVGASVFSTDSYTPNELIGSWQNLDMVLREAQRRQLTIVPCFITNTIGMGGALMRETLRSAPETLMRRDVDRREFDYLQEFAASHTPLCRHTLEKAGGASRGAHALAQYQLSPGHDLFVYEFQGANGESCRALLQMNGRLYKHAWIVDREREGLEQNIHCVQLGSEDPFDRGGDGATVWSDTVHRSVHLSSTRQRQLDELAPVLDRFGNIRCDMAHLAGVDAWRDYPEIARRGNRPVARMLLETYFNHGDLINQDPSISVYANFLFDWLVREGMNIPAVMWHIHDDRKVYEQHRLVAFVENHDEKGSTYLPEKGAQALIIASAPVESVLWGQNQRIGDSFRIAAQLHVPRDEFVTRQNLLLKCDREASGRELLALRSGERIIGRDEPFNPESSHLKYLEFFRKVERLAALPVFRSKESTWHRAEFSHCEEPDRVFHIVRELQTPGVAADRALVVVDARRNMVGSPMTIDVAKTFNVPEDQLSGYSLVDLLSAKVYPASPQFEIDAPRHSPPPHSYAFALVAASKVAQSL